MVHSVYKNVFLHREWTINVHGCVCCLLLSLVKLLLSSDLSELGLLSVRGQLVFPFSLFVLLIKVVSEALPARLAALACLGGSLKSAG